MRFSLCSEYKPFSPMHSPEPIYSSRFRVFSLSPVDNRADFSIFLVDDTSLFLSIVRRCKVKLAEALLLRGDIQKKLASLRERIGRNGVVQEGDTPHEDPNNLLKEAFVVLDELRKARCFDQSGQSSTQTSGWANTHCSNRPPGYVDRTTCFFTLCHRGDPKGTGTYSVREIKWVATMDVGGLQSNWKRCPSKYH